METDDIGRLLFAAPRDQFPMPAPRPGGFQAAQILYREFDSMTRPTKHYYIDIDKPTPCRPDVDINAFVRNIAVNGYKRNKADAREEKALDIPVFRDSFIVLELYKGSGFTFNPATEAVTLATKSADPPANTYGALHYVDSFGDTYAVPIPNCRLVYFAAKYVQGVSQDDPYTQSLSYNLLTVDGTITIIDPDVRHPGVGGN